MKRTPIYCRHCGGELLREHESVVKGYDEFTGKPDHLSSTTLRCPVDQHVEWRLEGDEWVRP